MARDKVYFGTNTKMYKTIAQTVEFLTELDRLTADLSRERMELFVIPSFTALESARRCVPSERITLGAQNMGWEDEGQFTGEISPLMLREVGTRIVEIGHFDVIMSMVNQGLGIGFNRLGYIQDMQMFDHVRYFLIDREAYQSSLALIYRKGHVISDCEQYLMDIMIDILHDKY